MGWSRGRGSCSSADAVGREPFFPLECNGHYRADQWVLQGCSRPRASSTICLGSRKDLLARLMNEAAWTRHRCGRAWRLVATLALFFMLVEGIVAAIVDPTSASAVCKEATEYFDVAVLGCNRCVGPTGGATTPSSLLEPDPKNVDALGLASSCACRSSAYRSIQDESTCASTWPAPCNLESCASCPRGHVPTSDATQCMACGNSTLGIDYLTNDCKCPPNSILVERNQTGELLAAKACVACANGTRSDPVTGTCSACEDPSMTLVVDSASSSPKCACRAGSQLITSDWLGVAKCVSLTRSATLNTKVTLSLASPVRFSDFSKEESGSMSSTLSFASDLVQDMFLLAASECYFYRNERQNQFCQALGNLCVLQHLSPTAAPCALFDLIQKSGRPTSANGVSGWFYTLPFLSYKTNAPNVLQSTAIGMKMSFNEATQSDTHDHLEFMIATYSVNGTLKNFRRLTNQLLFCLDGSATAASSSSSATPLWTRFGVSTTSHFTCDLSVLEAKSLELHELFLIDQTKSEGADGRYVPVPVQNLNYADERGLYINRNKRQSDAEDDFLSNRFFLVDAASGVQVGESKTRVVRYANSIKLTIRTQASDPSRIHPPLLTISYVDTQTPPQAAAIKFEVVYASDTGRFWSTATTLFVIACVVAAARVVLHIFTWQRRNTRNEEMALTAWHSFSHLITSLVSNMARACFLVLFVLCLYFLLFFKLQSSIFLMLPEINSQLERARKDEYYPFRVLLPLAFCFQLVTLLEKLYHQCQAQLFLIDWEKPRAKVIDMDSSQVQPAPVSVWRTILVANEWNELQTARKTSLNLTLVVLLFLLYGCDLRSLALPIPRTQMTHLTTKATTAATMTTDQDLSMNLCLRFATVSSLWLLICIAQRLWKWMIYERFFDEPREQVFVDLCTVAKVSCFIVDETYHGFYLHCRSPYPFADGSMAEIVDQLKQEAAGLTVGRGLDGSLPDCQTFEMFFTRKWKRKYLTLYNAVHDTGVTRRNRPDADEQPSPRKQLSPTRGRGDRRIAGGRAAGMIPWQPHSTTSFIHGWHSSAMLTTQTMVQHAEELSDFLKLFIENQDDQFRWRIYRMETCLSRFFGIPPDMSTSRQSFFLPDADSRFTRVLCLGIENDLMLMNILCFTAFDLWLDSHAISALATYLLEGLFMGLRAHFGSKTIARHSLVDSRFLI